MPKTNPKAWIEAAIVRAIKTMAQAALGVLGSSAVISTVDWRLVLGSAALAGLISILTSLTGLPEVPTEDGKQ